MMKLQKTTAPNHIAKAQPSHQNSLAPGFKIGNLTFKSVLVADTGDGAFTDQSVKIKPNTEGPGFVFKCVDRKRLEVALLAAGFNPTQVEIKKGNKHWVAIPGAPKPSLGHGKGIKVLNVYPLKGISSGK